MNLDKLFDRLSDIISKNNDFLLTTHAFPDGDALGSIVAVYDVVSNLKKNVFMVCSSEIPYQYKFLPHVGIIKRNLDDINLNSKRYISICLDSADRDRIKLDFNKLREGSKKIINIDHHQGNTNFGDINIVVPEKSATAEIIYDIIVRDFKKSLNHRVALGLYTGILTDTGKFQYSNTSPSVHRIAGHLMEYDISASEVFNNIYEKEPYNRFKLLQFVLRRVKLLKAERLTYSYILQKDFETLNLPFASSDGIIETIRSVKDAKITALFKQVGKDKFKVSLRSSDSSADVAKIASLFGGGGHKMASAYSENGNLKNVISKLVSAVRDRLDDKND